MMNNAPGKAAACLAVLADGPATTAEVAAETGLSTKIAGTHLANQAKLGKCTKAPFGNATDRLGRHRKLLWSLKVAA